ncbi:MAG: ABC transporter permease, partial [Patescibacteria group bacterium]|nr:ABC transporter permease [Patescibacteria group bacterium]
MRVNDVLKISIGALKKNRLRTLLTILGVVIGISSVTVIISAGESMEKLVYDQMASFGSDMIQAEVRVPSSSGGAVGQVQGIVITTMTEKDRHDILALPYIDKAYSAITAQEVLAWEGNTKRPLIFAVTEDFIDIDSSVIDQRRLFTDEEDRNLARVVVLGQKVEEDLFGASQAG